MSVDPQTMPPIAQSQLGNGSGHFLTWVGLILAVSAHKEFGEDGVRGFLLAPLWRGFSEAQLHPFLSLSRGTCQTLLWIKLCPPLSRLTLKS